MSQLLPGFDLEQLTIPERLELIGQIWDSIPDTPDAIEMPDWHRRELERRLEQADAGTNTAIPWEQVRARLRNKP